MSWPSRPTRGVWIEMSLWLFGEPSETVAPHAGRVD